MPRHLVSLTDLYQHVPATRTAALSSTRQETEEGPILVEQYDYPDDIPAVKSPAIEAYSVGIALSGTGTVERTVEGGPWRSTEARAGLSSLRLPGHQVAWRGTVQNLEILSIRLPVSLLHGVALEAQTEPCTIRFRETVSLDDPVLTRLGQALHQEMETGDKPSSLLLTSIAESIASRLIEAHRVAPQDIDPPGTLSSQTVEHIRDYVYAHLDEDLEVAELARLAGLGVSHFTRLFKETTGYSPYQYVLRLRIQAARKQLDSTEHPIAQVALDTGFSSQSHLTRRFKEVVGTTPGRYRKMADTG